jgi:hypothetical protein
LFFAIASVSSHGYQWHGASREELLTGPHALRAIAEHRRLLFVFISPAKQRGVCLPQGCSAGLDKPTDTSYRCGNVSWRRRGHTGVDLVIPPEHPHLCYAMVSSHDRIQSGTTLAAHVLAIRTCASEHLRAGACEHRVLQATAMVVTGGESRQRG